MPQRADGRGTSLRRCAIARPVVYAELDSSFLSRANEAEISRGPAEAFPHARASMRAGTTTTLAAVLALSTCARPLEGMSHVVRATTPRASRSC